jgi:hypothetical protein
VCAAIVCVLSLPAAAWLFPAAVIAAVLLWRRPVGSIPVKLGVFAGGVVVLAVPRSSRQSTGCPKVSSFRAESELGNLFGPLSKLQAFGIWPVGDFRVRPHDIAPTYVLIAVVCRRRDRGALVGLGSAERGSFRRTSASSRSVPERSVAVSSPG